MLLPGAICPSCAICLLSAFRPPWDFARPALSACPVLSAYPEPFLPQLNAKSSLIIVSLVY